MKFVVDSSRSLKLMLTNSTFLMFFLAFLISCESTNIRIKENDIFQISDSQYEQMRFSCSKITNQPKTVFLNFKLGSTSDEGQRHLNSLVKEKKLKKIKTNSNSMEFFWFGPEKYVYDFIIDGKTHSSNVSYNLDLEKIYIKHVTVSIDYLYNSVSAFNLDDITKVVDLLKIKYGEPIRAIKNEAWYNRYYWLKDGYEIELWATHENAPEDKFLRDKYVFHIKFTDLTLEYANNELEIQRKIQKSKVGKEKMINDL